MATPQNAYQEPKTVLGSGIPFVVSPTGTVAANGVVTLGTALAAIYSGGCYMYLAAGAAFAGSTAGWYWVVMSSTTVGVIFNNNYVSGAVSPPAVNTPIVAAGPGAYTGVTTAVTGPQITIPPGLCGPWGAVRLTTSWAQNSSANNKTSTVTLAGTSIVSAVNASVQSFVSHAIGFLKNLQNLVSVSPPAVAGGLGAINTAQAYVAANFGQNPATAPVLAIGGQLATATDYLVLEGFLAETFFLG